MTEFDPSSEMLRGTRQVNRPPTRSKSLRRSTEDGIRNGMNLTNVDPFNQKIVLGAVLTIAVLLDTLKRRGFRK